MRCNLSLVMALLFQGWNAQPYLRSNGQTRHSFAQTAFGIETQVMNGGHSYYINSAGNAESVNFSNQISPRFNIAGIHFWGHADFYVSIPLYSWSMKKDETISYRTEYADIFGMKFFPWAIKKHAVRPYFGTSVSGMGYKQSGAAGDGALHARIRMPLLAGLNYCSGKYLFDLGLQYNYDNGLPYYISRQQKVIVKTAPLIISFSMRKWLETTMSAEKNYRNGTTQKVYENLKSKRQLSSWFFGLGPSSAFMLLESEYNSGEKAFMQKPISASVFPEIVAGYFYEPIKMHVLSVFRTYKYKTRAYNNEQFFYRASAGIEAHRLLFDYNGFVPYVGGVLSYEWLRFKENDQGVLTSVRGERVVPGVVMGWDILPDKLQSIVLRTNLRYYPGMKLKSPEGKSLRFDQLEFNFIQVLFYPQRMKQISKATHEEIGSM